MVDPILARAYGTLAGFGFIGVALLEVPGALLLEPAPEREAYFLTLVAALTGLLWLAFPWEKVDPRWLHVVGVAATIETAVSVAVFGQPYVVIFFLIAVFAAYFAPDLRVLGIHLALICVALFGPVIYGPEDAKSALSVALITAPTLLLTAGLFAYLRQKMVHDRRAYHRFAEQTLVLSSQIAGRQLGPPRLVAENEPILPLMSRLHPPRAALAAAATLVGLPIFAGGLAVAGVKLPDIANDPFEELGVELPNQEEDVIDGPIRVPPENTDTGGSSDGAPREAEPGSEDARARADGQRGSGDGAEPSTGNARDAAPAPEPAPAAPPDSEPAPVEPETPSEPLSEAPSPPQPLEDLLDEATEGLEGVLSQLQSGKP
jgi:hypothetical protein